MTATKKSKRGGKRVGAGRHATTGSDGVRPIQFRVTADQRAELDAEAQRLGLTSGDMAVKRRAGLG